MGSLSINRVICFRKEPESTDIRTHLDGKLKGVHIGQQPQPIRNSCIATHVYMSRRRPLGENVAHTHTHTKRWVIYDPIYSARRSPVFPWRWIDDGWPSDHHLPSAQESERPSLVRQWSTHTKEDKVYFFPSFFESRHQSPSESLSRLWSNQMADLDDEGYLIPSLLLLFLGIFMVWHERYWHAGG